MAKLNKVKDLITVVETIYHLSLTEDAFSTESTFQRELETVEQPYERKGTATEEWQPIDGGWLKDNIGMLSIKNLEGNFTQRNPTEEERIEVSNKIIELRYHGTPHSWLIRPGESMRGCPESLETLHIRCRSGNAKFSLCIIPG